MNNAMDDTGHLITKRGYFAPQFWINHCPRDYDEKNQSMDIKRAATSRKAFGIEKLS
jgi:hypothetical protein